MKQSLNEELIKIKYMMGLKEQKLWDKIKNTAQTVGNKIQTGVNQVAQTIADKTKSQQPTQQISNVDLQKKHYMDTRAKWILVNSDKTTKGFGEGSSRDESMALTMAEQNGRVEICKKIGKYPGKCEISAALSREYDYNPAGYTSEDGIYYRIVVMDLI
jgi:hypothetical protein